MAAIGLCLAACETPVPAAGDNGAFTWGTVHPEKGSDRSAIWGIGAACQGPASDVFEHMHEECVSVAAIDGMSAPSGSYGNALLPPGPHRIFLYVIGGETIEYEVVIAPKHTYRPHAEEEDDKLYVWLTEHPMPMAPFDDGVLFAGVPPPE